MTGYFASNINFWICIQESDRRGLPRLRRRDGEEGGRPQPGQRPQGGVGRAGPGGRVSIGELKLVSLQLQRIPHSRL